MSYEMNYYIDGNDYCNSYFGYIKVEIDDLLERCVSEIDGKLEIKPPIVIFGKPALQRRNVGFFSDASAGYSFAGQTASSIPLTPALNELLSFVNITLNSDFNGILINEYMDGNDYIGKHSDNENGLADIGVVCISYGAKRKFRIRTKPDGEILRNIPTTSKELWIMGGDFQKHFTHEIPVEKKVKDKRISFTFRKHIK